jgi:hypothetical protein
MINMGSWVSKLGRLAIKMVQLKFMMVLLELEGVKERWIQVLGQVEDMKTDLYKDNGSDDIIVNVMKT